MKNDHTENLKNFSEILAESNENECFRFMSYIVMRLEYLHEQEHLKATGYVPS
jgi:hypothetical protein